MPLMAASRKWCARHSRSASSNRTPGAQLHGDLRNCYKIKLRKQGYRLGYSVEDDALVVLVLAVDKREDMVAYRSAVERLLSGQLPPALLATPEYRLFRKSGDDA